MENFNFSLFNNIEKDDYTNMLKCFTYRRKTFEAGETICDYTMQHKQIGIVEEGTVLMVKIDYDGTRTIVEALEKGEIFGEAMAFSQSVEDSVFAESETKTTIMFIDYD
ncbi:MAG: Crp/Fnr family transcriptional regulator, partial [Anaerotignaceae bacterium]